MSVSKVPASFPNASAAEFAEAVGRALLAWQAIEAACAKLFACLVVAHNTQAAITAFYSINGFAQRLIMMKNATRAFASGGDDDSFEPQITALLERATEATRLRNQLSHSKIIETFQDAAYVFHLEMPEPAWAGRSKKGRLLHYPAVRAAEGQFQSLAADIETLTGHLAAALGLEFHPFVPN